MSAIFGEDAAGDAQRRGGAERLADREAMKARPASRNEKP